ncbi:Fe-Mn family superoxide dismutase [Croceifilum oryzae]|uniref:superoxide dismutase n=1 Tax=Croceifilum oryzae TaxID=1553429 RepID=A0AAJ1TF45_9BACL|nr:superoxide dismutase [Croceifilum oryzae]MDQ0417329.1 Fe-Mn family superoxide dismutase [Croceifilum oryzae]
MNNPYYVYVFDWIKTWIINACRIHQHWLKHQRDLTEHDDVSIKHLTAIETAYRQIEQMASSPHSSIGELDAYFHKVLNAQNKYERYLQTRQTNGNHTQPPMYANNNFLTSRVSNTVPTIQRVPMGQHQLPSLPYPYHALEPYIDEVTMRIHHSEHHKKYVDDLNTAEIEIEKARQAHNFDQIKYWEREAAYNGVEHYLHTIFWDCIKPNSGGVPTGSLIKQIQTDFEKFSTFKSHFSTVAEKITGGWVILVWNPRTVRLEILQIEKQQSLSQWDGVPLLCLDVWEHAYYLKYPNRKKEYIKHWWNVVNWDAVKSRFYQARNST